MINQSQLKKLLTELKSGLEKIYGSRLKGVYLYGSYARGDQKEDSDLDILLVLDDFKNYWEEIRRTSKIGSELSLKYDVSICKVYLREQNWLQGHTSFLLNLREDAIAA